MMQATPHVYVMHIDDGAVSHPGGSNNYFVGDPGEEMVLIDTGDQQQKWTQSILGYYETLGRPRVSAILITHSHNDHIGGLDRVYDVLQAPVRCHPKLTKRLQAMVGKDVVVPLRSREVLSIGKAVTLRALFTPGHEVDHVCFFLKEDRALFTGDCILGASSSTVRDLSSYMKSLQLLTRYTHDTIYPGHGPVVPPPRGAQLVRWYIKHREQREQQILAALAQGISEVKEITRHVYPRNLRKGLRQSAEGNVVTHLEKLKKEGRVVETPASYTLRR
jgi:glyoxylase-like metal-dependent hydrolase (beta-lactamase superfamily II)